MYICVLLGSRGATGTSPTHCYIYIYIYIYCLDHLGLLKLYIYIYIQTVNGVVEVEEDLARVHVGHRDGRVEGVLQRLLWQTDECALAEDHSDGLPVDLTTYLQVAEL